MKTILMAAGAAAVLLTAGAADAATKHKHGTHHGSMATIASPSQPIPYTQLDAYLGGSPKQRASNERRAGSPMASTGANTNAAATAPATSGMSGDTSGAVNPPAASGTSSMGARGSSSSMGSGAVNPPTDAGSSTGAPGSATSPQ